MSAPVKDAPADPPRSRNDVLAGYVTSKVVLLQAGYLRDDSAAAASLAKLRRAVGAQPGADPGIWSILFDGLPPSLAGRTDEPSRAERAIHAALTLYAIHQQSRQLPMHRDRRSLGLAAGDLARTRAADRLGGPDIDPGVLRRFQALGTASTLTETLYHARALITQLRSSDVSLDYGRLAVDLLRLQQPGAGDGIRLSWGRDFYRISHVKADTTDPIPEGEN